MRGTTPDASGAANPLAIIHRKLFARMDRDQDNRVTLRELRASGLLRKVVPELNETAETNIFDHADVDGDGVLSRAEAHTLFQRIMRAPGAETILAALVANDPDPDPPPAVLAGDTTEAGSEMDAPEPEPLDVEARLECERARRLTPEYGRAGAGDGSGRAAPVGTSARPRLSIMI